MQRVNGIEQAKVLPAVIAEVTPIRQLIKAADVAKETRGEHFMGRAARFWQAEAVSASCEDGSGQKPFAVRSRGRGEVH